MKIEILGTGCSKCNELENRTKQAVAKVGIIAQIEKVEDLVEIMSFGIASTPALVINNDVKVSGRVPSVDEIVAILNT